MFKDIPFSYIHFYVGANLDLKLWVSDRKAACIFVTATDNDQKHAFIVFRLLWTAL